MTTLAILLAALVYLFVFSFFRVLVLETGLFMFEILGVLFAMAAAYGTMLLVCIKKGDKLLAVRTFATIAICSCFCLMVSHGIYFPDLLGALCCIAMWVLTFVKKH